MIKAEGVGAKHTRHSAADVLAAALRILDQYGLADLTMRRLAAALDVQPSALYWHFANKQTLLAAIADQIVARANILHGDQMASGADWIASTRHECNALRDALLAFRDGAEVVSSTLALGLGAGEAHKRLSAALATGGFEPNICTNAAAAMLHFILGHVSHEQQRMQADSLGVVAEEPAATAPATPTFARAPAPAPAHSHDAFDFGITLLVTGLHHGARTEKLTPHGLL